LEAVTKNRFLLVSNFPNNLTERHLDTIEKKSSKQTKNFENFSGGVPTTDSSQNSEETLRAEFFVDLNTLKDIT